MERPVIVFTSSAARETGPSLHTAHCRLPTAYCLLPIDSKLQKHRGILKILRPSDLLRKPVPLEC